MKAPEVLTKLLKTVVTFLGTQRYFSIAVHKILTFNQLSGSSIGLMEAPQVFRRVLKSYLRNRCTFSLSDLKILISYQLSSPPRLANEGASSLDKATPGSNVRAT